MSKFMTAVLPKEPSYQKFIPYSVHVTDEVIKTHDGDYVAFFSVDGVCHESLGPEDLNGFHDQLHGLMRNIASPNVAVYTHELRVKSFSYPGGEFLNDFADALNKKYSEAMKKKLMFENKLFISFVFRPTIGMAKKLAIFDRKTATEKVEQHEFALQKINDIISAAKSSLPKFGGNILTCYEFNGKTFSQPLEFVNYLINNEWQRVPVPDRDLRQFLPASRMFFGKGGSIVCKSAAKTQMMAVIGISGYPSGGLRPDCMDDISKLPYELSISQSFCFIPKYKASLEMTMQQGRLLISNDASAEQVNAIDDAKGGIDGNEFSLGEHSFSIIVKADEAKELDEAINAVGTKLSDIGCKWVRKDLASIAGYYSQLPGNFKLRINVWPITSENFCALGAMHNFPRGRTKNQWGDPVCAFRTSSGGSYLFNFHDGDGDFVDTNHMEAASTLIVGITGAGKTVTIGFLLAMLQKFRTDDKKLTCAVFDRHMGTSLIVKRLGGKFYPLRLGVPSGFNPMQLEPNQFNKEFMSKLINQLVRNDAMPTTPAEDRFISEAVDGVCGLPKEHRSISAVREFLAGSSNVDGNSIADRLGKWCKGGAYGWLFDNNEDTLDVDLPVVGFDVTEFLENEDIKNATMLYLMHRINKLMDGRRLPIFIDEFGVLLDDGKEKSESIWGEMAEKGIVTARKNDSFYVLAAQDPVQLLRSKSAYALVNQTSTKIFLPNPTARRKEYIEGFGLTEEEYKIIRGLGVRSRQFLIKQGHKSVVAELDLKGFDDELAILSGNINTAALCEQVISEVGDNPEVWGNEFNKRRKKHEKAA